MTPKQIKAANEIYLDMFADDLDAWVIEKLPRIRSLADLDAIEDEISAGAYDAIEAVLSNR